MGGCKTLVLAAIVAGTVAAPAWAAPEDDTQALRQELTQAKAEIAEQQKMIAAQDARLRALEARVGLLASTAPAAVAASTTGTINPATGANTPPAPAVVAAQSAAAPNGEPGSVQTAPQPERVGQAAPGSDRPPEVAVLGSEGSVVTHRGQFTTELGFEYARSDRNQALFRGIQVVDALLIGVFNISQSRQDVLTASASARYGLTDRLELGVRVPFVHRTDFSELAPIQGSTANDAAATVTTNAHGSSIGDVELSARYQAVDAHGGWPYLIANLQVVAPTGTNPFTVPRDGTGAALKAATGAGFWGVSPSVTAILPSDPAVLFGTIGYTRNFGRAENTFIPPVTINYVKPGDSLSFSGGIGISLNQRTSINFGYAHTWAFGTLTRTSTTDTQGNIVRASQTSRDLQLGRYLFGVSYRASDLATINWSVEVGATQDAPDVRTVLRIPLVLVGH